MGSAPSQPAPMSEKTTSASPRRRDPSAADLLASLSLQSSKAPPTASISLNHVAAWEEAFEKDASGKNKLAQTALHKTDFLAALINRKVVVDSVPVYNLSIKEPNKFISSQKSSGRCWLFAMTNVMRQAMSVKYNLEDFELSQSYLFFYDSLSKANWALEQMIDLAEEPLDDRVVQYLLSAPENDGGQWDMAVNLVELAGVVPQSIFPESFNSSNTGKLDNFLTSKIRGYTLELRELHASAMRSLAEVDGKSHAEKRAIAAQSARKRKEEQMEEVYRILAITLGTPPKPDEEFTWEYYDAKKVYHKVVSTPLQFAKDYASAAGSPADKISLIHDPRNPPGLYTVDRLGNVVGGRPVLYVNTDIETLKDVVVTLIKAGKPVWHGSDVGQSSSSLHGIMATKLFDIDSAFATSNNMTKRQRLETLDSAMTHAMVISAVNCDENGKALSFRVENSWGPDAGIKGYMHMTADWFDEHVFQVVADRSLVPREIRKTFETDPKTATVLPPYDPMGALARPRVM